MSVINYAIEIDTGKPAEDQNTYAIKAGVFRYITGRPGYTGAGPTFPKWEDTTNNEEIWFEDWLIEDGLGRTSREIDISISGDYGNLSNFEFSIRNDRLMWYWIYTRQIYLNNRPIKAYVVIDNVFYQIFTGIIVKNIYDEITYTFICDDNWNKIHKIIPPLDLSQTVYPDALSKEQGKSIPICIGDISYAKLAVVNVEPEIYTLNNASDFYFGSYPTKSAAATKIVLDGVSYPELTLYTVLSTEKKFTENQLTGRYVFCCKGSGPAANIDELIRIRGNDATDSNNYTNLILDNSWDDLDPVVFNKYYIIDPTLSYDSINRGYFSIGDRQTVATATTYDAPNQALTWAAIDFSHAGVGTNCIQIYIRRNMDFYVKAFKGGITGELLGTIHCTEIDPFLYRLHITKQYGTIEFTLQFVNGAGTPIPSGTGWSFSYWDPTHSTSCNDTWWFSITEMANDMILSTGEVKSFERDPVSGIPYIYTYDTQKQDFIDASFLIKSVDKTTVTVTGHPQVNLYTSRILKDGSINYTIPITPEHWSIRLDSNKGYIQHGTNKIHLLNDVQAIGTTTQITDKNMNTYADLNFIVAYPPSSYEKTEYPFFVNIDYPTNKIDLKYDELYIAFDMRIDTTENVKVVVGIDLIDPYGSLIIEDYPNIAQSPTPRYPNQIVYPLSEIPASKAFDVNLLPELYYDNGGTLETGYSSNWGNSYDDGAGTITTVKSVLQVPSDIITSLRDGLSSNVIKLSFVITSSGVLSPAIPPKFSGSLKLKQIGFIAVQSLSILSDAFYVKCKGELIDGEETNNVYNAFRLMLETYDGIPFADINYNNLATTRKNWPVGRQIVDRKSSFDYIKELCMHSFVACFPDRFGKRSLKSWRDDKTSSITLDEGVIIRDSINNFNNTDMKNLFNDFQLLYNENQATGKFQNAFTITKVDQSDFPDEDTMMTNPAINLWKTYVGGLNNYVDADKLWSFCHTGFEIVSAIQTYEETLSKLYWFNSTSQFKNLDYRYVNINDSAYKLMQELVHWTTRQKAFMIVSIPTTTTNVQLELLDFVTVSDKIFTNNLPRSGWITQIEYDFRNNMINLTITMDPLEDVEDNLYIEDGILITPNTMDEDGSRTDQVDDGQGRI